MRLDGSCQCGKVAFHVESDTPYPYQFCFCSICRKTTGGTCGVNIMGRRDTLVVTAGRTQLKRYHAVVREKGRKPKRSEAWRVFCGACGTHLWLEDKRWPDGVWPNAGAIDTPLPVPPERTLILLADKPDWVPLPPGRAKKFDGYPDESIADWHRRRKLHG